MNIRFVDKDGFYVVGYAKETELRTSESDLGVLWCEYEAMFRRLPESARGLYGVMWYTENHKYFYLLGIESEEEKLLAGATKVVIPAAHFAVATVPTGMTETEAWHLYFEDKLPGLGWLPDAEHGVYFEHYHDGISELWTPVKRNA